MDTISVVPIQTGWVQFKRAHAVSGGGSRGARVLATLLDREWTERLPILCWLVRHLEGLTLIDTGESSRANDPGYQPWWHPFMHLCERRGVLPEEEVGAQLMAMGHDPQALDRIVMTHMHGDHAGGLPTVRARDCYVSPTEANLAFGPRGPLFGYLNSHYPKDLTPRLIQFDAGAWEGFDRSALLTTDGVIRVVPTPGHTAGHVSVVVDLGDTLVFIAGDAAYSERALLDGIVDGVAGDAGIHRRTTARIRELCKRRKVITQFAHDRDSLRRLRDLIPTTVAA